MPILPLMVAAGTLGTAFQGAKLIAQGAEELTGLPFHTAPAALLNTAIGDARQVVSGVVQPVLAGFDFSGFAVAGHRAERAAPPTKRLGVGGFGDTVASVLDPFHLVTTDPADERDQAQAQAKSKAKKLKETRKALAASEAQAVAADTKAADLDKQAAAAQTAADAAMAAAAKSNDQAKAANARTKKVQADAIRNKAAAARKFAELSRTMAQQSEAKLAKAVEAAKADQAALDAGRQPDQALSNDRNALDQAFKLAQTSLSTALAARNPPVDARDTLASNKVTAQEKSIVANVIDSMNRGQAPDYQALSQQLNPTVDFSDITDLDPAARGDGGEALQAVNAVDVSGHDHEHAPGASCGVGCGCDPCKARDSKLQTAGDNKPANKYASGWGNPEPEKTAPPKPEYAGGWGAPVDPSEIDDDDDLEPEVVLATRAKDPKVSASSWGESPVEPSVAGAPDEDDDEDEDPILSVKQIRRMFEKGTGCSTCPIPVRR